MSVKDRIKMFAKSQGLTNQQFETKSGLSNGYVSNMRDSVGKKGLEQISKSFPQLNTGWLLTGEGSMHRSGSVKDEGLPIGDARIMMVPLISKYAYAGYLSGYGDDEYVDTLPMIPFTIPDEQTRRGEYLAIEVKGDSMDNGSPESLIEGDILLCRRIKRELWEQHKLHLKKWNFVIVGREGILVKRIADHDLSAGTITIHSLNEMYQDEVLDLREVSEILNVVQFMRKPII